MKLARPNPATPLGRNLFQQRRLGQTPIDANHDHVRFGIGIAMDDDDFGVAAGGPRPRSRPLNATILRGERAQRPGSGTECRALL
jgi:hypothetical protein